MSAATIHATCVLLAGAGEAFGAPPETGILLLGESGAGKSGLALQLIAQGAALVADDRVELFEREGALWARAPACLAGLIEARGIGIVKLPFVAEARVALAVRLVPERTIERLPGHTHFRHPDNIDVRIPIPLVSVMPNDPVTPAKVVLAAAAHSGSLFREEGNTQ